MKRDGEKQKAAGARAWVVCALVLALRATTTTAQTTAANSSAYRPTPGSGTQPGLPGLMITVRVCNYAHIATALLLRSEREAAAIFRQAGVETTWVDCPLSEPELERIPTCQRPMSRADFVLRIRSSAMTQEATAHDDALGSARECLPDGIGCSAEIFNERVADWSRGGDIAAYQLLGHVIAHELGHLLLGPDSHSPTGLMRAAWDPKEIKLMARGYLPFTAKQRRRLRVEVLQRAEQENFGSTQSHQDRRAEYETFDRR